MIIHTLRGYYQICINISNLGRFIWGVADKLLFKKIALEEISRLSLDKNLQRFGMTSIECAIYDGLVNALEIYEKGYLKNL